METRAAALNLVRPLIQKRTVILTGSAAHSDRMTRFLADAGARTIHIDLGTSFKMDARERFAAYERALAEPTQALRHRLDAEDPDGTALVYAGSFTTAQRLCGRRILGARSPSHFDAERKESQRELLGLGGDIVHLVDGLRHLSLPAVVQGIPDKGLAMATSHTYLVPRSADARRIERLTAWLSQDCTRAIVKRFDPGIPCTFYGFITNRMVVDFGPVEGLVYWDEDTWRIYALGILRPLRIAKTVLASARLAVYAIGRRLQKQVGYSGAFGTDGVLTDDSYIVHEINPRVCAGFGLLDELLPSAAPLAAIDLVLREIPEASVALTPALTTLSLTLQRDPSPAHRLWEEPRENVTAPVELEMEEWARQIRAVASGGLRPIVDLKELVHENHPA